MASSRVLFSDKIMFFSKIAIASNKKLVLNYYDVLVEFLVKDKPQGKGYLECF